jgi:hypothetical protein
MTASVQYAILLPDDEEAWEAATPEFRESIYERHRQFSRLLSEHGHEFINGAELAHSRTAKTVSGDRGAITVTEGPYTETVEQLTGFYLVRSSDLDDLLDLVGLIAGQGKVEVRACMTDPDAATTGAADVMANSSGAG